MIIKKKEILIKNLSKKKKINFIPTMGNLHKGHINLLKIAKRKNHFSLVSIFVNPLQFNDKDDFINYPRTIDSDLQILKKNNVDMVFLIIQMHLFKCQIYRKNYVELIGQVIFQELQQ